MRKLKIFVFLNLYKNRSKFTVPYCIFFSLPNCTGTALSVNLEDLQIVCKTEQTDLKNVATTGSHSAGLDSGCGSRIGFINEELGTSFASADPAGCSHSFSICADKSQDVPRVEEGKVKASS